MNAALQIELSDRQRDLLLRGLRFVRSSRMLEFRDSSDLTDDERQAELKDIAQLRQILESDARSASTVSRS